MSGEVKIIDTENEISLDVVSMSPMQQMQQAKQMGLSVPEMKEMMDLQIQYESNEARKAFHLAMAKFKENPPTVYKDMINLQYNSGYVSIGNMVNSVNTAMGPFGLNARWEYPESNDEKIMIVTCILSHAGGHEEKVTLPGPLDISGSKNPLQARKSTRTYLKLETFEAVTGTASIVGNLDDDGNGGAIEVITADQLTVLNDLIIEVKAEKDNFLKFLKVDVLDNLPSSKYAGALNALEAKRAK